jgi:hypothetical protein
MNQYTAYYKLGPFLSAIISVLADDIKAAEKRIEDELKKPGRGDYLRQWEEDGRIIKQKEIH